MTDASSSDNQRTYTVGSEDMWGFAPTHTKVLFTNDWESITAQARREFAEAVSREYQLEHDWS